VFLTPALSQTQDGAVDRHAHSDPDGTPRSIDAVDLAKLARSWGHASHRLEEPLRTNRIVSLDRAHGNCRASKYSVASPLISP
jgi:hypothetical protein